MSENELPQDPDQWMEMLRAVMGDETAERIIEQMRESGVNPAAALRGMENLDVTAVMNQVRSMLGSSGDGPVDWSIAEKAARYQIQNEHYDSLSSAEGERAREALSVASLWLDPAVDVDPCTGPNQAWSRLDWLAHSLPTFKRLTEPVAENVGRAFIHAILGQLGNIPEEFHSVLGDSESLPGMRNLISAVMGLQYGRGMAELSTVCFGTADAGLPLVEGHTAALVPSNVSDFAEGLDAPEEEVRMFVAIREQAVARLYSKVPWLRPRVLDAVAAYAREIQIDMSSMEEQVRETGFDPQKLQEFDLSKVFSSKPTESQSAALAQLEHLLSLVEGWVSAVSLQVASAQLPHAVALGEMFGRRAAVSSPAQRVFGPLVGLHIRPRANREAQRFWEVAYAKLGAEGRDGLWKHPDLLPTSEAIEDPDAFFDSSGPSPAVAEELDAFLAELLGEDDPPTEAE